MTEWRRQNRVGRTSLAFAFGFGFAVDHAITTVDLVEVSMLKGSEVKRIDKHT